MTGTTLSYLALGAALFALPLVIPLFLRAALRMQHADPGPPGWRHRVVLRYLDLGASAWMFAWFKTRLDPMFQELPAIVQSSPAVQAILDLGCGQGVAGCALLDWLPDTKIYGIDPDPRRVRLAAAAFARRGYAVVAAAPDFESPGLPDRFHMAILLDMIHFLPDDALALTLRRVRARMDPGARLVLRSIILPATAGSLAWKIGALRRKLTGGYARHRSIEEVRAAIAAAGFAVDRSEISGRRPEMCWFIAYALKPAP